MAELATRTWTLKVQMANELRRMKQWPQSQSDEPSFELLRRDVGVLFDMSHEESLNLNLKYTDDEGDLCTLTQDTLGDCFELVRNAGSTVIRLTARMEVPLTLASTALPVHAVGATCVNAVDVITEETPSTPVAADLPEHDVDTALVDAVDADTAFVDAAEFETSATDIPDTTVVEPTSRPSALAHLAEHLVSTQPHSEISGDDSDRFSTATAERLTPSDRLTMARPHITGGLKHFTKQVTQDFKEAMDDMKVAFEPPSRSSAGEREGEDQATRSGTNVIGTVAGVGAGIVNAVRFVPVRATRLAAESVAAIAKPPLQERTVAAAEVSSEFGTPMASDDARDEVGESRLVDAPGPDSTSAAPAAVAQEDLTTADAARRVVNCEWSHFTKQVGKDFKTAREEVRSSIGVIVEAARQPEGSTDASTDVASQQQSSETRTKVPDLVASVAGFGVAATLMPLHAVRTAVASTTGLAAALASNREMRPSMEPAPAVGTAVTQQTDGFAEVCLKDDRGKVTHKLPNGMSVRIVQQDDTRFKVDCDGKVGWAQRYNFVDIRMEVDGESDEALARRLQAEEDTHIEQLASDERLARQLAGGGSTLVSQPESVEQPVVAELVTADADAAQQDLEAEQEARGNSQLA